MEPEVTFVGVVTDTIELNAMGDKINERHYKTLWRFQDSYFIASAAYFAQDPAWGGISVNETFIYESDRNGDITSAGIPLASMRRGVSLIFQNQKNINSMSISSLFPLRESRTI